MTTDFMVTHQKSISLQNDYTTGVTPISPRRKTNQTIKELYLFKNYTVQIIIDKFTKLSNIDFSKECFIADFSQLFSTNVEISILESRCNSELRLPRFTTPLVLIYR